MDKLDDNCERVELDYIAQLRKGNDGAAEVASSALNRIRAERERTAERLSHAQARLEEIAIESPADAALDAYNERRSGFQRIRGAVTVEDVNDELRAQFQAFRLGTWAELDHAPGGERGGARSSVTIDPILREQPREGIGWREDERGDIHYLGPVRPLDSIETGNRSQE